MRYAVRIDVLGVAPTTDHVRDVMDFLDSRTDLTLDKIVAKDALIRARCAVEAPSELPALMTGVEALMGALYMIVGKSDEIPSVSAFVEGPI